MGRITIKIPAGVDLRADQFLADSLGLLTRSQIKARNAVFSVGGREVKASRKLKEGDEFGASWDDDKPLSLVPEDIPLRVLYEDDDVIVIDKVQGMVVHPANGNYSGTLVNALLGKLVAESFPDPGRAGIVHRLDKETSGVILAAKHPGALELAQAEFRSRRTAKTYLAILAGVPKASKGRIVNRLARDPSDRKRFAVVPESDGLPVRGESLVRELTTGVKDADAPSGKLAVTDYRVLASWSGYCLVLLSPHTGRTHQLRVHMRHLGTPIAGDPVYGRRNRMDMAESLMLHAWRLEITLPSGRKARFRAPVPMRFKNLLRRVGGKSR